MVICSVNYLVTYAQEGSQVIQDFQTWSSIELKKSFSKELDVTLEEQLRLRGNSSQLRQLYTDAGIKYEVIKNLSVSANFRYSIKPLKNDQRFYTDISYSWKKNNFKITPRIRVQHEFVKNNTDNNYLRPKIEFEYKVNKKFKPFISGELFYHVLYYKGSEFDEYRLSAGAGYDLNKRNSFKLFYLQQQQFDVNAPQQNHVLGVGYEYDF